MLMTQNPERMMGQFNLCIWKGLCVQMPPKHPLAIIFFSVKMHEGHFTSGFIALSRTVTLWEMSPMQTTQANSFNPQVTTFPSVPASSWIFFFC